VNDIGSPVLVTQMGEEKFDPLRGTVTDVPPFTLRLPAEKAGTAANSAAVRIL
jgi:hypothetical protein